MHAISSCSGNRPTQTQTGPITMHCAAASAQCKQLWPLGSCGFSLFPWAIKPERLSKSNPSVLGELTKKPLKIQQNWRFWAPKKWRKKFCEGAHPLPILRAQGHSSLDAFGAAILEPILATSALVLPPFCFQKALLTAIKFVVLWPMWGRMSSWVGGVAEKNLDRNIQWFLPWLN